MKKLLIILPSVLMLNLLVHVNAQNVLDGLYLKEHTPGRSPIPYTSLREADVMWNTRVWRNIDMREKLNHPIYFPTEPIGGRMSLFDVIKGGIETGSLIAFNDMYDDFKEQITKEQAIGKLITPKVIQQENPDMPGSFVEIYDTVRTSSRDVVMYLVKEDWFFDKQRSVLDVRIIGICPVVKSYDESGAERGYKKLFWLYFPNCREVFANSETFNRQNDAERRTYDDIFWKRMFSSYITKQSNVYDRSIDEYETGMDALLEGEKIKGEIFTLEMDLWHY